MTSYTTYATLEAGKTLGWRMLGIDVIAIDEYLMRHPEYNEDGSFRDNVVNLIGEHCMDEITRHLKKAKETGIENMVEHEQNIEDARKRAEEYIKECWGLNPHVESEGFFEAIWIASTELLPALEVQVVIDGNNNCHVTTGSAGYVEFGMKPPVGMKLPIRCWIHTHPFGSAYFSGVDWNTVNTWKNLMQEAYVLGGVEHYGYWTNEKPNLLMIKDEDNSWRTQYQVKGEEE